MNSLRSSTKGSRQDKRLITTNSGDGVIDITRESCSSGEAGGREIRDNITSSDLGHTRRQDLSGASSAVGEVGSNRTALEVSTSEVDASMATVEAV
jgi:hypothetical protein